MTSKQTDLSGWRYENWSSDNAEPPVVMNPRARLHTCIAWCWGEAREAHELAINAQCYEQDVGALIDAIQSRLMPLERMLEALSARTQHLRLEVGEA